MRKMSAKLKLTLWTTLLMLLMAGVLMTLLFSLSDSIILSNSETQLSKVVGDNAGELEFEDGRLDVDDIDFFKSGVYTLLYTQDGERLAGNLPEEFMDEPPFNDKEISEVTVNGTLYYTYDILSPVEDSPSPIWIRGVMAGDTVVNTTNTILQIALIFLPVVVLLGALGSYFVSRKTFKPIDKIIKTTEEISKDDNLSLRIALKGESAEIQKLADAFDVMFARLEKSFESEKQFTSDVSHELRTPTAVILAQCEYALGDTATQEDKEEALETVQRQATKTSKLISDLLNLTRLDSGIEGANFNNINVSELVRDICEEHALIAPFGIELTYNITPHIMGSFDESMLTRLLGNLISNAFQYSKKTGTVKVMLTENEKEIILSVKDDGKGIDAEHREKIWQRFYQVDASRTSNEHGSMGLGLSMVKQIARLHRASIELESVPDVGSLFTITFPKK